MSLLERARKALTLAGIAEEAVEVLGAAGVALVDQVELDRLQLARVAVHAVMSHQACACPDDSLERGCKHAHAAVETLDTYRRVVFSS